MTLGNDRMTCYNFRGEGCMMRPGDMTDFETYLIKRIDDLEGQLSDRIAEVDKKVTWIYAFATGVSFVAAFVVNLLSSSKN